MDEEIKTMVTRVIRSGTESKSVNIEDASALLKELSMKPRDRYKFIRTIARATLRLVSLS